MSTKSVKRAVALIIGAGFPVSFALAASVSAQQTLPYSTFQAAESLSSILTNLNSGFFSQGQSFTSVPPNAQADQVGRGVWVRGSAGLFDVRSLGAIAGVSGVSPNQTRTTYGGAQAGLDLGKFNIGSSGLNVIFGVTGGDISVFGSGNATSATFDFDIPFVGTYIVVSKGGFVGEVSYRHDFIGSHILDFSDGIDQSPAAHADTGAFSASYKFNLPQSYFVEPSGTFYVTRLVTGGASFNPTDPTLFSGTFQPNPVNSDLGRLGFRLGKDFSIAGVGMQAFFAFSAWHEFAGSSTDTFTTSSLTGTTYTGSTTRIGTFEQYGIGVSATLTKDFLGFVRGDVRSGANLTGNNITGGFRYNF